MSYKLVIVESPSKAKTIEKYLPKDYKVLASVGHVIDLPKSKLGIDIENDFTPEYKTIHGKGKVLAEIKKKAKNADEIILATDDDREGEAISWHLANYLNLDLDDTNRIRFQEITPRVIKQALENKDKIDMDLVNAQQARRVLDRLVGYKISPVLWSKVMRGLSAGRVQSVATRIIIDRENEIRNFKSEEYWNIEAIFKRDSGEKFESKLVYIDGKKAKIENKEQSDEILKALKENDYVVSVVKHGSKKRNAPLPFRTSTLQQDAINKINFSSAKTMTVAQQLYEGIEIKNVGQIGLITYLRTDSTRLSEEAVSAGNEYIESNFGKKYLKNKTLKKSSSSAVKIQDAHEAIRPTDVTLDPETIRKSLTNDQYKLYKLIYNRFLASLMAPAEYTTLRIDILNGKYTFRSTGLKIKFDGFLKVYDVKENDIEIPLVEENEILEAEKITPIQKFTQPPPRYTEASLNKTLEESGIGRPSTYATIMSTIKNRGYVTLIDKKFHPTVIGEAVDKLLRENFEDIVDVDFTANMEDSLDNIAEGGKNWKEVISDFYTGFDEELKKAGSIEHIKLPEEETDEVCEKCGSKMVIKYGRFGRFMACSGYPECKNTKPLVKELNVICPKCNDGKIVERKSKKGRLFYGCKNYPECDFVSWYKPTGNVCPKCGKVLYEKKTKSKTTLFCQDKECGYVKE